MMKKEAELAAERATAEQAAVEAKSATFHTSVASTVHAFVTSRYASVARRPIPTQAGPS